LPIKHHFHVLYSAIFVPKIYLANLLFDSLRFMDDKIIVSTHNDDFVIWTRGIKELFREVLQDCAGFDLLPKGYS